MNNPPSPAILVLLGIVCAFVGYWLVSRIIDYFTKGSSWQEEWRNRNKK